MQLLKFQPDSFRRAAAGLAGSVGPQDALNPLLQHLAADSGPGGLRCQGFGSSADAKPETDHFRVFGPFVVQEVRHVIPQIGLVDRRVRPVRFGRREQRPAFQLLLFCDGVTDAASNP
jgi:hypothetical protein